MNKTLTIHQLGGDSEQRTLGSAAEVRDVLQTLFGIRLPRNDPRIGAALTKVSA
jgi:arylamine N-acetyltransferase